MCLPASSLLPGKWQEFIFFFLHYLTIWLVFANVYASLNAQSINFPVTLYTPFFLPLSVILPIPALQATNYLFSVSMVYLNYCYGSFQTYTIVEKKIKIPPVSITQVQELSILGKFYFIYLFLIFLSSFLILTKLTFY